MYIVTAQLKRFCLNFRTVSISSEDEEDSLLRELNQALEGSEDTDVDGGEDFPHEKHQLQNQVIHQGVGSPRWWSCC